MLDRVVWCWRCVASFDRTDRCFSSVLLRFRVCGRKRMLASANCPAAPVLCYSECEKWDSGEMKREKEVEK